MTTEIVVGIQMGRRGRPIYNFLARSVGRHVICSDKAICLHVQRAPTVTHVRCVKIRLFSETSVMEQ